MQLGLYYGVGRYVSSRVQSGAWGEGSLKAVSAQLRNELPGLRGFSERNLYYMKTFYEEWSQMLASCDASHDPALASAEKHGSSILHSQVQNWEDGVCDAFFGISFTAHRTIIEKVKPVEERLYYIRRCADEHLSVESLKREIRLDAYHHQGQLPNNFARTLDTPQQALRAISMFKDEYLLDFINVEELGVRDAVDVDERVVEQAIVHNVKNFIMTFGRDFTFVGNQYHLDAFGEDQYIDLLFFNRELNCLVAVELKTGAFKTAYLGQLSGYLSILDGFVRKPHENPSIGIVLCKDMNRAFVDYIMQDYEKPMGVSTYKTSKDMPEELLRALPDIDDLKLLLERGGE